MNSPIWILGAAVAVGLASCTTYESSVEDVKTTKYLEFGKYAVGQGSVFILTSSYLRKEYPGEIEKNTVPIVANRLRSLGYSISPTEGDADYIFFVMWGVGSSRDRVTSYNGEIRTVLDVIHEARGEFMAADKSKLWSARVSEVWGHANVDAPRLVGLLMEKFPN